MKCWPTIPVPPRIPTSIVFIIVERAFPRVVNKLSTAAVSSRFGNALLRCVCHVDGAWTEQKRLAPGGAEGWDICGVRHNRSGKTGERAEMNGWNKENFVGFRVGRGGGFDLLAQFGDIADNTNENLGNGFVGNHVRGAATTDDTDIESAGAESGIDGQRHFANAFQRVEQFLNGGFAEFGISGVGHAAVGDDLKAERAFGAESELIFGGLAINEVLAAARSVGGMNSAGAVAFFADDEEETEIAFAGGEEFLRGEQHGGDDAFSVTCTTTPDLSSVFARRDEGRDGIHVSGERDDGRAEADEDVIAAGFDGDAFDFAVETLGEVAKVIEKKLADGALIGSDRFDIDESASKLKDVVHAFAQGNGRGGEK